MVLTCVYVFFLSIEVFVVVFVSLEGRRARIRAHAERKYVDSSDCRVLFVWLIMAPDLKITVMISIVG